MAVNKSSAAGSTGAIGATEATPATPAALPPPVTAPAPAPATAKGKDNGTNADGFQDKKAGPNLKGDAPKRSPRSQDEASAAELAAIHALVAQATEAAAKAATHAANATKHAKNAEAAVSTPAASEVDEAKRLGAQKVTHSASGLSMDQFTRMFGVKDSARAERMLPHLNKAIEGMQPEEKAMFLAQVSHESGGLSWFREFHDGSNYEGRRDLGNVQEGDGQRFRGRGPIQLTGRYNYTQFNAWLKKQDIKVDVVSNPELLEKPELGFLAARWYWDTHGCKGAALRGDFDGVTQKINGGFNGLSDRYNRLSRVQSVLDETGGDGVGGPAAVTEELDFANLEPWTANVGGGGGVGRGGRSSGRIAAHGIAEERGLSGSEADEHIMSILDYIDLLFTYMDRKDLRSWAKENGYTDEQLDELENNPKKAEEFAALKEAYMSERGVAAQLDSGDAPADFLSFANRTTNNTYATLSPEEKHAVKTEYLARKMDAALQHHPNINPSDPEDVKKLVDIVLNPEELAPQPIVP